jgi:hypothetical protein
MDSVPCLVPAVVPGRPLSFSSSTTVLGSQLSKAEGGAPTTPLAHFGEASHPGFARTGGGLMSPTDFVSETGGTVAGRRFVAIRVRATLHLNLVPASQPLAS